MDGYPGASGCVRGYLAPRRKEARAYEEIRHTGASSNCGRAKVHGQRSRIRMKFAACEHRHTVALFTDVQYEMIIRAII